MDDINILPEPMSMLLAITSLLHGNHSSVSQTYIKIVDQMLSQSRITQPYSFRPISFSGSRNSLYLAVFTL